MANPNLSTTLLSEPTSPMGRRLLRPSTLQESPHLPVFLRTLWQLLSARDETHLRMIAHALEKAEIPHVLIREPIEGREDGEAMSIGIEPTYDRLPIKKVTSSLPCVR